VFEALFDFCRSEALPRFRDIFLSSEVVVAVVLGAAMGVFGAGTAVGKTATGDVVLIMLAYAGVAFGFSVAGLTLVLTAPDSRFASELAWSEPGRHGVIAATAPTKNSYSNLLFIFSWTAVGHWLVVVGSFAILLALGKDLALLSAGASVRHRVAVGVLTFAIVYAVELFLITVITLTQVGEAYIGRLHEHRPGTENER
jgi:hypothetical protein